MFQVIQINEGHDKTQQAFRIHKIAEDNPKITPKIRTCKCVTCSTGKRKSLKLQVAYNEAKIDANKSTNYNLDCIHNDETGADESRWASRTSKLPNGLVERFIASRRDGLSPRTIDNYRKYLRLAGEIVDLNVTGQDIQRFLASRKCTNGGKHAYFRCLRAFYNWLYSPKSGLGLKPEDNPILIVEAPKVEQKILPSLTNEQLEMLIEKANCVRDKAIISLFADSGLRLLELTNIKIHDINWQNRLIKVKCKGNKEGYAPFGQRTETLLIEWLSQYNANDRLWNINSWSIVDMLKRLEEKTGLRCNPHTFRRTFASILAKRGIDSLHIMRLGRWESMAMVERYTRSVKFEDSLKLYESIVS